jgi:hypothetical protein
LSDTNQRSWKGFVPTFSFNKTYWHLIGSYKIDWFFAKWGASRPGSPAPRSGRALREINTALGYRISDHVPITVDLPLNGFPVPTAIQRSSSAERWQCCVQQQSSTHPFR